jgi:adenylate cyclase
VAAATVDVEQFFEDAPRITYELSFAARLGALPLDRPRLLGALLTALLRAHPHLAWIGYAETESGRFIGSTQRDGELVEYVADPKINGGVPEQWAVTRDGDRSRPSVIETEPYLVLDKEWFKQGIARDGPVWSPFYKFTADSIGITCMTRFTPVGADKPIGLFDVDLRLIDISKVLSSLEVGDHGAVFLVDSAGTRLVSPTGPHVEAAGAAVDAAAARRSGRHPAAAVSVEISRHAYEVTFAPVAAHGLTDLAIAVVVDRNDITHGIYTTVVIATGVGLAAALFAIVLGIMLSARIAKPVTAIATDLATIGKFEISTHPAPQSFIREISDLGTAVDRMKASLRSFGHYVPVDVVRALLSSGREAELGGETRRLTMHFSDIENFTTIAEGMTPDELVAATRRYFELMTNTIERHGGTLDKFVGDGVVAFYNAPMDLPNHAHAACLAALECQQGLLDLQREQPSAPIFRTRIGLGLGDVVVGNIGTSKRFAYTMLGDDVNLASRLEGLNKAYGTYIMASQRVVDAAGAGFEWRALDRVAVKGRHGGTVVYELLGRSGGELAADLLAARNEYARALECYFDGEFESAAHHFDEAALLRPGDVAAPMMAARARELAAAPPADWDGIHVMHEK